MKDSTVVSGAETGADLACDLDCLVGGQPADAAEQGRELLALDELHREKVPAVNLADVVNAADVLVRHLSRHAHFTMKTRQRRAVGEETIGQKLERDRLTELEVVGPIDLPHSAPSQQTNDAVAVGEDGSRNE